MKNLIVLLILLISAIGFSQSAPKGMVKIDGFQEPVEVEVNALVAYVLEDKVLIISRNGLEKYEIATSYKFEKECEYFFILDVTYDSEKDIQQATLKGYDISILQAYKNIKKTREKVDRQNKLNKQ